VEKDLNNNALKVSFCQLNAFFSEDKKSSYATSSIIQMYEMS
jgi:hypothetical protein